MELVKWRKFSYVLSLTLVIASIISLLLYGLKLGIDFTGGTLVEVEFSGTRPEFTEVSGEISKLDLGNIVVQPIGNSGFSLRTRELSSGEPEMVIAALSELGDPPAGRAGLRDFNVNTIGPTIGRELRQRSIWAMILVLSAIILYIAWAFRKVSKPVSSWFYGLFAILALFHDIAIPIGVFSLLGKFKGVEVDTLFVTALLTVLGFSVHDTIVVFDRVRENLRLSSKNEPFDQTVGKSLRQTITRSINTSLTVLIVLLALFFFGAESTKYFSLALIIGIVAGTYSSIFIASPLLVTWHNFRSNLTS